MLILSRKKDESIMLDKEIEITVIGIEADQVKIGINAPKNIEIFRKEVYLSILKENEEAATQTISLIDLNAFLKKK